MEASDHPVSEPARCQICRLRVAPLLHPSSLPQEVYSLAAWFADVLQRHQQLVAWTAGDMRPPPSIWLPG